MEATEKGLAATRGISSLRTRSTPPCDRATVSSQAASLQGMQQWPSLCPSKVKAKATSWYKCQLVRHEGEGGAHVQTTSVISVHHRRILRCTFQCTYQCSHHVLSCDHERILNKLQLVLTWVACMQQQQLLARADPHCGKDETGGASAPTAPRCRSPPATGAPTTHAPGPRQAGSAALCERVSSAGRADSTGARVRGQASAYVSCTACGLTTIQCMASSLLARADMPSHAT